MSEAEIFDPMALEALRNSQRQLDRDGCEVGVSRQALDMAIAFIDGVETARANSRDADNVPNWFNVDAAMADAAKVCEQHAKIEKLEAALRDAWPYVRDRHGPIQHKIKEALANNKTERE